METKENRLSIGKVNGVEIYAVIDENKQTLVPIRQICEAIRKQAPEIYYKFIDESAKGGVA